MSVFHDHINELFELNQVSIENSIWFGEVEIFTIIFTKIEKHFFSKVKAVSNFSSLFYGDIIRQDYILFSVAIYQSIQIFQVPFQIKNLVKRIPYVVFD